MCKAILFLSMCALVAGCYLATTLGQHINHVRAQHDAILQSI